MKFDYVVCNPPYQDSTIGDNDSFAPAVYDKFMDAAYEVSDNVVMIHPARFLFDAGSTPKKWNKKMLSDPDYKVLMYNPNSKDVFSNVDIKGGVAISLKKKNANFGAIEVFTPEDNLNTIFKKVHSHPSFKSLSSIVISSYAYHFTEKLHQDCINAKDDLSKGHAYDFKSNVFEKIPYVFHETNPDNEQYLRILGRLDNSRIYKFIKREYVKPVSNLDYYKIFLPRAIGTGKFGESITDPILGYPSDGSTETFLSIGSFDDPDHAQNLKKYVKTKFARALLGIMKRTQTNTPGKWLYVPIQDFTNNSDIDWSKSLSEIDEQLYRKYGLSDKEIAFIEEKVQAME